MRGFGAGAGVRMYASFEPANDTCDIAARSEHIAKDRNVVFMSLYEMGKRGRLRAIIVMNQEFTRLISSATIPILET